MPAFRIAVRYLLARKSHTAVNVISYISMAGIAVAAMAMVCVLSVFNGFSDLASERLSMVDPDIKVTSTGARVISNADSLARELLRVPGVRSALPTLSGEALAIYVDAQLPVNILGVPCGYGEISALNSLVIDGEMNNTTYAMGGAVLGVGTAVQMNARPSVERSLLLTVPRRLGRINPAFPMAAFTTDTLLVSGVYRTNQTELDNNRIVIPLDRARNLLDYTTEASAIEIGVSEGQDVGTIVGRLSDKLGDSYLVADRLRQESHSFRMISVEKWITFLMLVFVLVMASFNILSSLSMLIIEKEESLMILSSIGAPDSMLRRIFLDQGVLVATAGGAIGILIGVALCLAQQHYGFITLGGDHSQMSIVTYPCVLRLTDVFVTAAVVLVIGFISGFISSRAVRPPFRAG
ncbi:MAG: ABC transporter permease [Staphylococcus sp.]|nr:ABC transporter permease [Staphylococcus sp.]